MTTFAPQHPRPIKANEDIASSAQVSSTPSRSAQAQEKTMNVGIASSAHWWCRKGGGCARTALYLLGQERFFQLVYSDDFNWSASGERSMQCILAALPVVARARLGARDALGHLALALELRVLRLLEFFPICS